MRRHLTRIALGLLDRLTRRIIKRRATLLPLAAAEEASTLEVSAPYRVHRGELECRVLANDHGTLRVRVLGYDGYFPNRTLADSGPLTYEGPTTVRLKFREGLLDVGSSRVQWTSSSEHGRRYALDLSFVDADGRERSRLTGHYDVYDDDKIEQSYYDGANYVSYEEETAEEPEAILALLRQRNMIMKDRSVLEVGCATGRLLSRLRDSGFQVYGIDISAWAVEQAARRVGADRVAVWDVANDDIVPAAIADKSPFEILILWSVFEHFADPFAVLARLGALVSTGGTLLIHTSNADSLTRFLFQEDWEGYFDWSHYGVDRISVRTLKERLPALGWRIEAMSTSLVWDRNADPTRATLRDWYTTDARFRRLLAERDRGDFITLVATKL